MPTIEEFESLVTKEVSKRSDLIHFVLWSRNRQTKEELELMGDFTLIVLEILAKNFPTLVYDSGYVRLARHSLPSYLAVLDAAKGLIRLHMEMTEPGFDARRVEVEARRARPLSMPPLASNNKVPAIRRVPSGTPQTIQHSQTRESISALRSIETNVDRPTAGASRTPTSRTPTTSTPASTPALTPTPADRPLLPRTSSYEWTRSKSSTPPELIKPRSSPPPLTGAKPRFSTTGEAPRQRTASATAESPRDRQRTSPTTAEASRDRQRTSSTPVEASRDRQRTSSTPVEAPRERQRTSSTTVNGTATATTPTSSSRSSPPVALLSDPRVANAIPRPQRSPFRMQLPAGAMPPREVTYTKPLADVGTPPKIGTPPTPTTPGFTPCPTMPWGSQASLAGSPKATPSPAFMTSPHPGPPPSRPSSLLMPERPASILLPSRPNSMISPCVTRLPAEALPPPSSHSRDASSLSNILAEAKAPEKKVKWRFPWTGGGDSPHKSASDKKTYERAHERAYDKTAGKPKKESLLSRSRLASGSHSDRKNNNPNNCNCGGVHY